MSARRSTLLFESGTPINDAWLTFAADDLRTRLSAAVGAFQAFNEAAGKSILAGFTAASEAMQARLSLEEQMRSDLLDELFNDQLIATGYRVATPRTRWPVIIDPSAFDDGEPNWKKATLSWRGQQFVSVRVTDPSLVPQKQPPKRKGRPGSGSVITAAIEHVIASHPEFCSLNRELAAQLVRDEIGVEPVSGNGLSTKSLERYIRQRCGIKQISK